LLRLEGAITPDRKPLQHFALPSERKRWQISAMRAEDLARSLGDGLLLRRSGRCSAVCGALLLASCVTSSSVDRVDEPSPEDQGSYLSYVPLTAPPEEPVENGARATDDEAQAEVLPGDPDEVTPGDPDRALAEAPIVQRDGDRLYALAGFAGLNIFDISQPGELKLLGSYPLNAHPVEMHVKGDVAYVLLNDDVDYTQDAKSGAWSRSLASRVLALDVADPAHPELVSVQDLAGLVDQSQLIGDVLYVAMLRGYGENLARIASFDVSHPRALVPVDELTFTNPETDACLAPAILFDEHVYVACAGKPLTKGKSLVHLVDISDPSGKLVQGAEFSVRTSDPTRFHLDEHERVLRVVGRGSVETFQIVNSAEVVPLASSTLDFSYSLRSSVYFDGVRAYVLGFGRGTYALDLSVPMQPKLLGKIDLSGLSISRLESHGDRLYALGADYSGTGDSAFVAMLDASGDGVPLVLDRVAFGGTWTRGLVDSGRVDAFSVARDEGLIAVAFEGNPLEAPNCGEKPAYRSGIQLIDIQENGLTVRGIAPQIGAARRLFVDAERVIGLTDTDLQSFDAADHDAPRLQDERALSRVVMHEIFVDDTVLRLVSDLHTNRTSIEFVELAKAKGAQPRGRLELPRWSDGNSEECSSGSWWGRPRVHKQVAFVPHIARSNSKDALEVYIIDLEKTHEPKLIGLLDMKERPFDLASAHDDLLVLTDHALLIDRTEGSYGYNPLTRRHTPRKVAYDVFDLEDPRAPRFATHFQLPDKVARGGWGIGAGYETSSERFEGDDVIVDGDYVLSQHEESTDDPKGRVRYYLDRLDVSNPKRPKLLAPINIPGLLARYEPQHNRLLTFDYLYRMAKQSVVAGGCLDYTARGFGWEDSRGICHHYDRRAHVLELDGDSARTLDLLEFDTKERVSQSVVATEKRLFYITLRREALTAGDPQLAPQLHSVVLGADGSFGQAAMFELDLSDTLGGTVQRLIAQDTQAIVPYGDLMQVIDTEAADPTLKVVNADWYCDPPAFYEDKLYCKTIYGGTVALSAE
jgi:hypothetical protein